MFLLQLDNNVTGVILNSLKRSNVYIINAKLAIYTCKLYAILFLNLENKLDLFFRRNT